jgi:hypothetical protein
MKSIKHPVDLRSLAALGLALILLACGGGGSGGDTAASGGGSAGSPPPAAQSLQTHLSACPGTVALNGPVACMVGLYEGKTAAGTDCAFNYGSDGVAYYTAGGQTVRADLSLTSAAVFQKKAENNAAGFAISWAIGIASGNDMDLSYRSSAEPASADGLFIKPKNAAVPSCLVETGPASAATGGESTSNLLGRTWQSPQLLNGSDASVGLLAGQPAFDAGLADDGHAFITFRQIDTNGRMAVQVVEGRVGGVGQSPQWTAPQVLDADAPLLAPGDTFRPRIAVSANGHAVVMWATQRACEADGYQGVNAGKTCRYVYASRRLASANAWEPAVRVVAAPLASNGYYYAKINSLGDAVLVLNGAKLPDPGRDYDPAGIDDRVLIARRAAGEANYRIDRSEWVRRASSLRRLSEWAHVELDEESNITIAAETNSGFGAILHTRLNITQPLVENASLSHDALMVFTNRPLAVAVSRLTPGSRSRASMTFASRNS